jgi:hypothetical protein
MRLLLAALLLVHGAAMGHTFACQYTASAGLNWENGRYMPISHPLPPPFFLKVQEDRLTADSVVKALGSFFIDEIKCIQHRVTGFSCFDHHGGFMQFSPATGSGGVSHLLGAVTTGRPSVSLFTCQKM